MEKQWSEELTNGTMLVSTLCVMKSAAGFYVGRYCMESDESSDDYCGGMHEPYSRESDYYSTRELAQQALDEGFVVRDCVENNFAYAKGSLSLTAK